MRNEQAKQEAIEKAWTELIGLEIFKCIEVDVNGFLRFTNTKELSGYNCSINGEYQMTGYDPFKTGAYSHIQDCGVRPKSLQYLETNNGWIRIEPDGSNLPKDKNVYRVIDTNRNLFNAKVHKGVWFRKYETHLAQPHELEAITHYKPIEPELLPIY